MLDTRRGMWGGINPKPVFGMSGSTDLMGFTEINSVAKTVSGFSSSFPVVVNVIIRIGWPS